MKTTESAYWSCQAAGWGFYTAMGISMATQQVGWRFSMVAGYVLFFVYSIALTDLSAARNSPAPVAEPRPCGTFARLLGAAFVLGAIQTFLVFAIDLAFLQRASYFLASPRIYRRPGSASAAPTASGCSSTWRSPPDAGIARRRSGSNWRSAKRNCARSKRRSIPISSSTASTPFARWWWRIPVLAQDMITRFATILRYNLHHDLNHTVPLEAEVEVVSDYLALEAVRLEDRLRVRFAIDPAAGKIRIPPMLLQTLVENAVKHGIAPSRMAATCWFARAIDGDSLRLEVENTGSLSAPKPGATQRGPWPTRANACAFYTAAAPAST